MTWFLYLVLSQSSILTTTGYIDSRTTGAWTQFDGAPHLTELVEGNVQLKFKPHERVTLLTDASFFWQGAFFLQGAQRDLANYRPSVVLSEAYADFSIHENIRFLIGKKRIVWGPGLAFNPTDVLNPPKDPTDPTFQRAGAWLSEVELSFQNVALSLVFAARATRQFAGLPTALIVYPDYPSAEAVAKTAIDDRDKEAHFSLAGRIYTLVANFDINVIFAFTNLYNDALKNRMRGGLTLSRTFGGLELHAEGMIYNGSSAIKVNGACTTNVVLCTGSPVSRPNVDATFLTGQALAGGRYQFNDDTTLSLEYYFNGEGLTPTDFRNVATLAVKNPLLAQQSLAGGTVDPGTPQKFTLNALRRHYLVLQASKPRIFNDWTLTATVLMGLDDISTQIVPQLQWMPKEWLQFSLSAYIPIAGVRSLGATIDGLDYGQFSISPFRTRILLQARAFF